MNGEYDEIEGLMHAVPHLVRPGGRLAIISFHSLEDKVVAGRMRAWESQGNYPALWRGVRDEQSLGKHISRKAICASANEVDVNPSARSARLRVFEFAGKADESSDGVVSRLIASYSRRAKTKAVAKHHK